MMAHFSRYYSVNSARGQTAAAIACAKMKRSGISNFGKIWTSEEERLVVKHYPDLVLLQELLPWRTKEAIKSRAGKRHLSVCRTFHRWTTAEKALFKKMYQSMPSKALIPYFPFLKPKCLGYEARRQGIKKCRRHYTPTGIKSLDALRERCFELRITMFELDAMIGVQHCFQRIKGRVPIRRVKEAVELLGGKTSPFGDVQWFDQ